MRLVNPLHRWQVGRGKRSSTVCLTLPDEGFLEAYKAEAPLLFLTELWVPHLARGLGYGHSLLKEATAWADFNKTDLCLYCSPYGVRPRMSQEELATFYSKHGFKRMLGPEDVDIEMVRRAGA